MPTNKLINETSPYLLQHAHNPVDWYPWGNEAFAKAKKENKAVFLSIGYSSCHWCHVMEKESFEDIETAKILNDNFVSIKVDREERPDLDSHYMNAVAAMTGSGGWPLNVFLTPDKKPFYGGTYFPSEPRFDMPGFKQVLLKISTVYKNEPDKIRENAKQLSKVLESMANNIEKSGISKEILDNAAHLLQNSFDPIHGGLGEKPKFPQALVWEFILAHSFTSKDKQLIPLVIKTLEQMAKGGIYDQVRGGFSRYSTDGSWLVPHFEKMLYDNALLTLLYLHVYQITKNQNFKRIIEESFAFIERELKDTGGAFYSAMDADSEGQEGKYYIWNYEELKREFTEDELKLLKEEFGVSIEGNFEGENILIRINLKDSPDIERIKQKLFDLRQKRIKPAVDDKIIVSWNSLMIISFALAGRILDNNHYTKVAEIAANFIWNNLFEDERLHHSFTKGKIGKIGFSDDYAAFALANLALFETTGDKSWMEKTLKIIRLLQELFWDKENGGFYHTSVENTDSELPRYKDFEDNPTPSGNSLSANLFAKLSFLTGNVQYGKMLEQILSQHIKQISNAPGMYGSLLTAVEIYFAKPVEIALVAKTADEINLYLNTIYNYYLPTAVVAAKLDSDENPIALLKDKTTKNGSPQVYICQNFTCKKPVESVEKLKTQLQIFSI